MRSLFVMLVGLAVTCNTVLYAQKPTTVEKAAATSASGNVVTGLKLPAQMEAAYDDGFVTVSAECKGVVQWLVLSTAVKVKYKVNKATPNDIDIAIPPYESLIAIYAVGLVDGRLTPFARTDIYVKGPPAPAPPTPTPPPPTPANVSLPLHLSIIEDTTARTAEIAAILNSQDLRSQLSSKQVKLRVYGKNDEEINNKSFTAVLKKYGTPMFILQDNTGKGLVIDKLPKDVNGLLQAIKPYTGN